MPGPAAGATSDSEGAACWRCGKRVARTEPSCPYCRAPRRRRAERAAAAEPRSPITAVTRVLAFFAVLLLVLIVHAVSAQPVPEEGLTAPAARAHLRSIVGFEIFDAIVVGIAAWAIGRPPEWRRLSDAPTGWLWVAAGAGLGLVLALNLAYHTALRAYIGVSATGDPILAATGVSPLVLFAYCLEPALVEELFFRYLALDTLRSVMNVHAAVVVSSVMFGLAHIGVPLSIPMLALVGMALGYARVAGGRLALPMLLHFLHNFFIVTRG